LTGVVARLGNGNRQSLLLEAELEPVIGGNIPAVGGDFDGIATAIVEGYGYGLRVERVTLTNASGTSHPVTVELQQLLPGFFLLPQDYVAAVRADGAYIAPAGLVDGVTTVPAQPGDHVLLFGTGFGATSPEVPAGQEFQGAAQLVNAVTIRIDTASVIPSFAGLSGVGLYQFNIRIPDLPDGDHSVWAQIGGVTTAKIGRIRIERRTTAATGVANTTVSVERYRDVMKLAGHGGLRVG
jgi:hypothetical protein